jgi:protoporphyrinogen oxidase
MKGIDVPDCTCFIYFEAWIMDDRVGVIGAGPAGLAAAYTLIKHGVPVDVFESDSTVGGMAKTLDLWDQRVDLGPHRFFSTNTRVNRLWSEILEADYCMIDRQTRILYNERFFDYPLRLVEALSKLGPAEAAHCLLSYFCQQFRREQQTPSFEEWVCRRFGRRLYEIFFRSYSEKLWGIPCALLDADFAAQRIRRLSLYEAIRDALCNGRGSRHATLLDRFAYPFGGAGSVYSKMADTIVALGGSLNMRMPARRVVPCADGKLDIEFVSGELRRYHHVVSTMPLTDLVRSLPNAPKKVLDACSQLHFRNTMVIYLRVEAQNLFPDQWIYIHTPALAIGRIANFRNWTPELYGDSPHTILSLELWFDQDDGQWNEPDRKHINRATEDLRRTGLIKDARITAGHAVRVPCCYPVYRLGYKSHLSLLQDYLSKIPGLHAIGRGGSFKYNNQDHSLLMGILAAEKIAQGSDHDLWSVNAEDSYQEAATIDEVGLSPQVS